MCWFVLFFFTRCVLKVNSRHFVVSTGYFSESLLSSHQVAMSSASQRAAGKVDSLGLNIGSFSGDLVEEDVNPASTAFITMISQHRHPPLPAPLQLQTDTSRRRKKGEADLHLKQALI